MNNLCKFCGTPTVEVILTPELIHHGRLECSTCHTFHGWAPKPFEYNPDFDLPFGKHKGSKLKHMATTDQLDYLRWMVNNTAVKGNMRAQIEFHLKKHNAQ